MLQAPPSSSRPLSPAPTWRKPDEAQATDCHHHVVASGSSFTEGSVEEEYKWRSTSASTSQQYEITFVPTAY
jgi:hypothetical protein